MTKLVTGLAFDKEMKWSVPYMLAPSGIAWVSDRVENVEVAGEIGVVATPGDGQGIGAFRDDDQIQPRVLIGTGQGQTEKIFRQAAMA